MDDQSNLSLSHTLIENLHPLLGLFNTIRRSTTNNHQQSQHCSTTLIDGLFPHSYEHGCAFIGNHDRDAVSFTFDKMNLVGPG
jgi:hypothetical protein